MSLTLWQLRGLRVVSVRIQTLGRCRLYSNGFSCPITLLVFSVTQGPQARRKGDRKPSAAVPVACVCVCVLAVLETIWFSLEVTHNEANCV